MAMPGESVRTEKLSPCLSEDFITDLCEENGHDASASLLAQSHIQKEDPERPGSENFRSSQCWCTNPSCCPLTPSLCTGRVQNSPGPRSL